MSKLNTDLGKNRTSNGDADTSNIKWCELVPKEPCRNGDGGNFLGDPSDRHRYDSRALYNTVKTRVKNESILATLDGDLLELAQDHEERNRPRARQIERGRKHLAWILEKFGLEEIWPVLDRETRRAQGDTHCWG